MVLESINQDQDTFYPTRVISEENNLTTISDDIKIQQNNALRNFLGFVKSRKFRIFTLIIAVVAVLVACIMIAIIYLRDYKNDRDVTFVEERVLKTLDESGIDAFIQDVSKRVEKLETNEDKAVIYSRRAGVLFNLTLSGEDKYIDQLLQDAHLIEDIAPSGESAYRLCMYESSFGNKEAGAEYCKLANERGMRLGE